MGSKHIKGFGLFMRLIKNGHELAGMGLHGTQGDVLRMTNRLRLVKSFRGLKLEGLTPRTTKGYDALMLVFLTHSALELYLRITRLKPVEIELAHQSRQSARLIAEVFDSDDRGGKLFDFLIARLDDPRLKGKLTACREKKCCNVHVLSSAIRHIFVHGHLTASPHHVRPERVHRICQKVSEFLVRFMDDDFYRRMGRRIRTR